MKKIIAIMMLALFFALSVMAKAEVTKDMLDNLTDSEKSSLKAEIAIALITGKAGIHTSHYSSILDIDLSDLSVDELKGIQDYLSGEQNEDSNDGDTLVGAELCGFKLLSITVDDAEIKESKWNGMTELRLPITIDNGNDFDYEGCVHVASVNGWQVHPYCYFTIKAGLKAKDEIVFDITGIDVDELDDIENISISFRLNYAYYSSITDEITLTLK